MKYFQKMTGEKCYLSPMNMEDTEQFTRWLNDQEVVQYLDIAHINVSLPAEEKAMQRLINEHTYSIIDKKTDSLIGNCGLSDINHLNRTATVGIFIGNKDYWGKGYGTEALQLLLDYGFNTLNLRNIMLCVYSFNERARACYEKIGFKKIGVRRKALFRNGKEHDIIFMDILDTGFYRRK